MSRCGVRVAGAFLFLVCHNWLGAQVPAPSPKIKVMVVGFTHLSQLNSGANPVDVLAPSGQTSIRSLTAALASFHPDAVMVEVAPEDQARLDAEYNDYVSSGKLPVENSSGETYQVAFALARAQHLKGVLGVDFYDSTPQGMLTSGTRIELYQDGLKRLQDTVREKNRQLSSGSISLYDYIAFINQPATIELTHRLLFNTPAYVRDGDFRNPPQTIDMSRIDKRYIGAEFIGLFYSRNLKLYSNILAAQQRQGAHRILITTGQVHVGVLQELLQHNPSFQVVEAASILK